MLHTVRQIDTQSISPMKTLFILSLVLLLFTIPCHAGDIAPADAKAHVGEAVTVKGTVEEVKVSAKAIFLDFGGKYPNQVFSVVAFNMDWTDALKAYQGKPIAVKGTVVLYKGKPEIGLHGLDQISQ